MPVHKIKIGELITALVNDAKEIEGSDSPQKAKTQLFKRLATKFINQIYGDARKSESSKIAPATARRYLTRARAAVQEFTGMHHRFEAEVKRMAEKWPGHSIQLLALLNRTQADTRKAKSELLNSLLDANEILIAVEGLDFSKSTVNNAIKRLADKYPAYHNAIAALSHDNVQASKQALVRTLREKPKLYDALYALKVDHELIVNLVFDKSVKAVNAKNSKKNLNTKKHTKVYVDYPRYMNQVLDILMRPASYYTADNKDIAPLVFALCAATGRRPVEILLTGDFKIKNKNELLFTGQAKKRDDDIKERRIYSLVDSSIVLSAFEILRASPITRRLVAGEKASEHDYRDDNNRLSGKISPHLSEFAKNFFIDKRRVFKDTRGFYGRICYQRWYLSDHRWKSKDDNIFFAELFGHADVNSQANYMPYQLTNFNANFEPNTFGVNQRWEALCELDNDMPTLARQDAAVDIHDFVKEKVLENPAIVFTQTMLASTKINGKKKFRGTIQNYLEVIGDLKLPGDPLTEQETIDTNENDELETDDEPTHVEKSSLVTKKVVAEVEKTKPPKKHKPHFDTVKELKQGEWEVIIKLNGQTKMFSLDANNKMEAMKTGYGLFVGDLFEFQVTVPFKKGPHFVIKLYAVDETTAETTAVECARFDGFKGSHNKVQLKKV